MKGYAVSRAWSADGKFIHHVFRAGIRTRAMGPRNAHVERCLLCGVKEDPRVGMLRMEDGISESDALAYLLVPGREPCKRDGLMVLEVMCS